MINEENFIFQKPVMRLESNNDRIEVKFDNYFYEIDFSGNVYFKTKCQLFRLSNFDITFRKDGLYGMLNNNGNVNILPKYGAILSVLGNKHYSFSMPDNKYKYGLIDRKGNIKVPAVYDGGLDYIGKDYYVCVIGEYDGLIDEKGNQILPCEYYDSSIHFWNRKKDYFTACKGDKYGVVDKNNDIIIPFEYNYICRCFNKGKYKNCSVAKYNGAEGIINDKNEIVVPFEYSDIRVLSDKTFLVSKKDNPDKLFIVDNNFNKISDVNFNYVADQKDITENYFIAGIEPDGNEGLIDKYGNIKIDLKYADLRMIYGLNKEEIYLSAQNEYGKYGIIDIEENVIVPFEYDYAPAIEIDNDYSAPMAKNGKWGVINIKTNEILVDFVYEDIYSYYNRETTFAKYNGKYGVINKQGQSIKYNLSYVKEIII